MRTNALASRPGLARLTLCLAALLAAAGSAAAAEPVVVDELIAIADADDPAKLAGLTLGETKFDAKDLDKVTAALKEHVEKSADAGKPLKEFKLVVPPHVSFQDIRPVFRTMIAAMPEQSFVLVARIDAKQAAILKAKHEGIVLTEGEVEFDRRSTEKGPDKSINVMLTQRGDWGYRLVIDKSPTAPKTLNELEEMLRSLQEPTGLFTRDTPVVIVIAAKNIAWSHVVQTMAAARGARYRNVGLIDMYREPEAIYPDLKSGTGIIGIAGGGHARNVVYIIDGPLDHPALQREVETKLRSALKNAPANQRNGVVVSAPAGPVVPELGADINKWLRDEFPKASARTGGGQRLVAALQKAIESKPDLIILYSGGALGAGSDRLTQGAILDDIVKLNSRKVRINTIELLFQEKSDNDKSNTLQQIAEKTGGRYQFISKRELGIE
ncbi:MAG: hypothetical protein WD768_13575 [Phycisphaeraceae bacterium]